MDKVTLLPKWILPDNIPSVYDMESGTIPEMVGKVYGAMRELQVKNNSFVDEINKIITDFINKSEKDNQKFVNEMTKTIHEYIEFLDGKVKDQDKIIADAVSFMKINLATSVAELVASMKDSGELDEVVLNAFNNLETRMLAVENKIKYTHENETITFGF